VSDLSRARSPAASGFALGLMLVAGCGDPAPAESCSTKAGASLCVDEPVRVASFPAGWVINQGEINGEAGSDLLLEVEEGEVSAVWFEAREAVGVSLGEPRGGASAGDLDGDGIDEVVTHAPGVLTIHSLDTNPATVTTMDLPFAVEGVAPVVLARSWGALIVFAGQGPNFLGSLDLSGPEPVFEEPLISSSYYYSRPFVGDFDGDGEPDALINQRNGNSAALYLSSEGREAVSWAGGPVIARDLDGDGADELLAGRGEVSTLGRHNWEELPELADRVFPTRDAVCPILIAANEDGLGPLELAELSAGQWTRTPYLRVWSDEFVPQYLGDFDGDQRCDVLLSDYKGAAWVAWGHEA
jgi:hypothetical protein